MIYGYARVSTEGQRDNNSLESQEQTLREAGATEIYADVISGAKADRPKLSQLLEQIKKGDRLVVCKLDRLSRSVTDGYNLIQSLIEKGVSVQVLNFGNGALDNTPTGKLMMTIFLAFAEFERETIRARMMEGKAIAKQKPDYHEGRPKSYTTKQMNHAMDLLNNHSYKQVAEITGISVSTLAREARRRKAEQLSE